MLMGHSGEVEMPRTLALAPRRKKKVKLSWRGTAVRFGGSVANGREGEGSGKERDGSEGGHRRWNESSLK